MGIMNIHLQIKFFKKDYLEDLQVDFAIWNKTHRDHKNHIFRKFLGFSEVGIAWEVIVMIVNVKDEDLMMRFHVRAWVNFFHVIWKQKMCYFLINILLEKMCFKFVSVTNLISEIKQLVIGLPHIHLTNKYITVFLGKILLFVQFSLEYGSLLNLWYCIIFKKFWYFLSGTLHWAMG